MARRLLDKAGKVLRPAILWNDARSFAECRDIEEREPRARKIAGNIPLAGFTAPKLVWVKKHEPRIFDKVAKVLLPKDYVRLRMTGDYASDMSDSSGTFWLDIDKRAWSDELLRATDMSRDQMPKLFEGTDATGTADAAGRQGLGHAEAPGGGGRRRRQCGVRLRHRRGETRRRLRFARHVGRAFRLQRALHAQRGARRPCLLPCRARHLAPDGRHPLGRRRASNGWRAC